MTDDPPPTPADAPRPPYKGAPLDAARGPGLGCFWVQVALLGTLIALTPIGVINAWPSWLSATMLIATLVLTLFTGQTVIFLLRLVAADRRSRRRPLGTGATRTVGEMEGPAEGEEAGADGGSAGPRSSVRQ